MLHPLATFDPKKIYILDFYGIIESYLLCSFARDFAKKKGLDIVNICIISNKKNLPIVEMFKYVGFSIYTLNRKLDLKPLLVGLKSSHLPKNIFIPKPNHFNLESKIEKFLKIDNFSYENLMSFIMLSDTNGNMDIPEILKTPKLDYYESVLLSNDQKKILICPSLGLIKEKSQEFWNTLSQSLTISGYMVVYSNSDSYKIRKLQVGRALNLELYDILYLEKYFDAIIAINSGFSSILLKNSKKDNLILLDSEMNNNLSKVDYDKTLIEKWSFPERKYFFLQPLSKFNYFINRNISIQDMSNEISILVSKILQLSPQELEKPKDKHSSID